MKQLFVAVMAIVFIVSDKPSHNTSTPKTERLVNSVVINNTKKLVPGQDEIEAELLHSGLLFSNY